MGDWLSKQRIKTATDLLDSTKTEVTNDTLQFEKERADLTQRIRTLATTGKRDEALRLLPQLKQYDNFISRQRMTVYGIDQQKLTLRSAATQPHVVEAIKASTLALQTVSGQTSVDDVEDAVDDNIEARVEVIENSALIADTLNSTLDIPDTESPVLGQDLNRELDELLAIPQPTPTQTTTTTTVAPLPTIQTSSVSSTTTAAPKQLVSETSFPTSSSISSSSPPSKPQQQQPPQTEPDILL